MKHGLREWKAERISALCLAPLSIWGVTQVFRMTGQDRRTALRWASRPWNAGLLALLLGLSFRHAQLGLEVVATDYVRGKRRTRLRLFIRAAVLALACSAGISILGIFRQVKADSAP